MKSVCVYCGSNEGRLPVYAEAARGLGSALVERGLGLVYGGASVGIMGVLADTVLSLGGRVTGVMPESIVRKEVAHRGLTELHVTSSMHERKMLMAELSDAFLDHTVAERFVKEANRSMLIVSDDPSDLLDRFAGYRPPAVEKWIRKGET